MTKEGIPSQWCCVWDWPRDFVWLQAQCKPRADPASGRLNSLWQCWQSHKCLETEMGALWAGHRARPYLKCLGSVLGPHFKSNFNILEGSLRCLCEITPHEKHWCLANVWTRIFLQIVDWSGGEEGWRTEERQHHPQITVSRPLHIKIWYAPPIYIHTVSIFREKCLLRKHTYPVAENRLQHPYPATFIDYPVLPS